MRLGSARCTKCTHAAVVRGLKVTSTRTCRVHAARKDCTLDTCSPTTRTCSGPDIRGAIKGNYSPEHPAVPRLRDEADVAATATATGGFRRCAAAEDLGRVINRSAWCDGATRQVLVNPRANRERLRPMWSIGKRSMFWCRQGSPQCLPAPLEIRSTNFEGILAAYARTPLFYRPPFRPGKWSIDIRLASRPCA